MLAAEGPYEMNPAVSASQQHVSEPDGDGPGLDENAFGQDSIDTDATEPGQDGYVAFKVSGQHIEDRVWFRLWRSGDFRSLWNRTRQFRDGSASSYEFALAKYGFHCGLTFNQVVSLIGMWWHKQSLEGELDRLVKRIIPDAYAQSQEAIQAYETAQAEKKAAKTTNRILAYLEGRESATPAEIAKALNRRRNTIIQACRRMAKAGSIAATDGAYSLADHQPKPRQRTERGRRIHTESVTAENLYTSPSITGGSKPSVPFRWR